MDEITPLLLDTPSGALAWNKLRLCEVDQACAEYFRNAYRFSALRSEVRAVDLINVVSRLNGAGIPHMVHKGWASARLYPNPELRSYGDIDLLIEPDHLEAAKALLQRTPIRCPIDFGHTEISDLDTLNWDYLFRHSQIATLGMQAVRLLGPEHHLRSLCIHCLKHGVASPLWLVDVAVAIEAADTRFDWPLCIGKQQPQANWVRTALSLAHRLLQAKIIGTPIWDFLPDVPTWLDRSVLRRWSRPPIPQHLPRLGTILKQCRGITEALAWRWPTAGQSTVEAHAEFSRFPKLHLQVVPFLALSKLKVFFKQLPAVWHADDEVGPASTQ